jgi:hypothetical protein
MFFYIIFPYKKIKSEKHLNPNHIHIRNLYQLFKKYIERI